MPVLGLLLVFMGATAFFILRPLSGSDLLLLVVSLLVIAGLAYAGV